MMGDLNFPLLLAGAVIFTGIVTGLDRFWLSRNREPDEAEPVVVEYSKSFFPVLLLVFVLRSFLVEPFQIPSPSMVPTLKVHDFILVNKFAYGIRLPVLGTKVVDIGKPERGDIMVFFPPNDSRYFIKRVIGLPGDEIRLVNNLLYINGQEMTQQLENVEPDAMVMTEDLGTVRHLMQKGRYPTAYGNFYARVPEGHYFMMGDNRDNSSDSRDWGVVPERNIVGEAFAIWMHWESIASLPSFARNGIVQ